MAKKGTICVYQEYSECKISSICLIYKMIEQYKTCEDIIDISKL